MPKILVHTAFNLLLSGSADRLRFEPGLHDVSDDVADHWYTRDHADVVDGAAATPKDEPKPEAAAEEPKTAEGQSPVSDPEADKAEKAAIREKLKALGADLPHHTKSLDEHRAALAAATPKDEPKPEAAEEAGADETGAEVTEQQ